MKITADCEIKCKKQIMPDVLRNIVFEYIGPEINMLKLIGSRHRRTKRGLDSSYTVKKRKTQDKTVSGI